jgi:hypothetical protein
MSTPWVPPAELLGVEKRFAACRPIYERISRALYFLAREDEALQSEAAIVVLMDMAADLMVASGILWVKHRTSAPPCGSWPMGSSTGGRPRTPGRWSPSSPPSRALAERR